MAQYIIRRILYMFITVVVLTFVVFVIIELPPGSFLDTYITNLELTGTTVSESEIAAMRMHLGLGDPFFIRYYKWIRGIFLYGDFGRSLVYEQPVIDLVIRRLPTTVMLSLVTISFTFTVSIFVGIYSATHQYSLGDNAVTFFGFLGLATPNFLLALVLMYLFFRWFGFDPGGLLSPQFEGAPWTWAKLSDFLKHLVVPVVVVGTAGTAGGIRTMRAVLLDELEREYVETARMKGVSERKLLFKYPVRVAINPMLSTIGWLLPAIISGNAIVGIVLNLPTLGPLLLDSLRSQDMFLAGTIVLFQGLLTVIGTLISDLLLAWSDPRIRYD